MKYGELKSGILSILHSDDYDFVLKLYDANGDTTLDGEDASWIYVTNENIMFELPTDDISTLCIWKEKEFDDDRLSKIIKRIREQCILNGVSLEVRLFDDLNRRKIYNLIKNSLNNQQKAEESNEMNESKELTLAKCLFEALTKIKSIRKTSDNFISEAMMSKNTHAIMENYIGLISSVKSLNTKHLVPLFKKVFLETSLKNVNNIVKSFNKQFPTEFEAISSNTETLKNAVAFVKECYINNREVKNYKNVLKLLENCVVYVSETKNDKDNLRKAYNHLISVCEGAKSGVDILRMIKKHNLCETYKISKDDLLDMWLSKSYDEKISNKKFLIFESPVNVAVALPLEMKTSLSVLAENFNSNGVVLDKQVQKIIDETVKYNDISDLIENYFYNPSIKQYASTLNEILKECLAQLNGGYKEEDLFEEYKNGKVDYSKELNALQEKIGIRHPGLKYIAIKEARENQIKEHHKTLDRIKDENVLKEGFMAITSLSNARKIAKSIVNTKITAIKPLAESDDIELPKSMFDNVFSADANVKEALNECLFYIVSNPARYESKKEFVSTLKKYVL